MMLVLAEIGDASIDNPPHPKTTCHGQMWKAPAFPPKLRSLLFGRIPILDRWRCPSLITRKLLLGSRVLFELNRRSEPFSLTVIMGGAFFNDFDYGFIWFYAASFPWHFQYLFPVGADVNFSQSCSRFNSFTSPSLAFGLYENRRIHVSGSLRSPFCRGAATFAGNQGLQTTKSNFLVAWDRNPIDCTS